MKIVEKDTQKSEQGFRALKQLFKVAKAKVSTGCANVASKLRTLV